MALILHLETATKVCSVAVAKEGTVLSLCEDGSDGYTHAEKLNTFVKRAMDEAKVDFNDLDAVAVSEGPGSYTGLRIGTSTAKGFAYALGIPILAVSTLEAMAQRAGDGEDKTLVIPMLDARRMEVFCAGFDGKGRQVFPVRAEILDAHSFPEADAFERVIALGDGADKALDWADARGVECQTHQQASAADMAPIAASKFHAGHVVDTAYFEPFYLKDFVAGKPKKRS